MTFIYSYCGEYRLYWLGGGALVCPAILLSIITVAHTTKLEVSAGNEKLPPALVGNAASSPIRRALGCRGGFRGGGGGGGGGPGGSGHPLSYIKNDVMHTV